MSNLDSDRISSRPFFVSVFSTQRPVLVFLAVFAIELLFMLSVISFIPILMAYGWILLQFTAAH